MVRSGYLIVGLKTFLPDPTVGFFGLKIKKFKNFQFFFMLRFILCLLCINTTLFGVVWLVEPRGVRIPRWKFWKSIFQDNFSGKTDFLVRFSVKIVHFTLQKYNHVWYRFAGCVWPREVSVAERKLWKIFVRDNFSGKIDFLMSFSFKMVHFTLSCFIGIVKSVWLRGIRIVECRLYKIIFQDNFPGKTDFFLVFYLKWSIILW